MKKYCAMVVAIIFVGVAASALAGDTVTGVWRNPNVNGHLIIIAQDGKKVYAAAYQDVGGVSAAVIAYQIGQMEGNVLTLKSKAVRKPTSSFGGTDSLTTLSYTLSADGNTLSGTWKNDQGEGPDKIIRVK